METLVPAKYEKTIKPGKMGKSLLLLLLGFVMQVESITAHKADSVSGTYLLTVEKTAIQVYADSMRLSEVLWKGIPGCTFGSRELPAERSRALVLNADKTAALEVKGGPWAGIQDLGTWQQDGDTICVVKDKRIIRKFLLSNHQEQRLTEMVRMWQDGQAGESAPFFLLTNKRYYRKINNGQKK